MATGILRRYEVHVLGLCGHLLGTIAMDRRWYPGLAVCQGFNRGRILGGDRGITPGLDW